jgi:hypothetical protein
MKKRIYKKYLKMHPVQAAILFNDGKISLDKYLMAYYASTLCISGKNRGKGLEETIRKRIYGT